jgi:LysR family transcriptional regulator, regulator of abg operon
MSIRSGRYQTGIAVDQSRGAVAMKLAQMRNIVAIAEKGSLRAAARHLGLAQPAISRSLQELERELGVALFERRSQGMVLTPVGASFARRANIVLTEVQHARDEVDQLHGGTAGAVTAALSIIPHIALLPRAIEPFRSRYPNVQLRVIEGPYATVETGLRDGGIDFYVGPPPERSLPADLRQEPLFDNKRVILCRKAHPLAAATSLRELTGAQWLTTSITHRAQEELGEVFAKHSLPAPRLAVRSQSALTMMVFLMHSDLLAMVPVEWLSFSPTAGALVALPVKEALPAPPIVAVKRTGVPLTPAAECLLDLIRRGSGRMRGTQQTGTSLPQARRASMRRTA